MECKKILNEKYDNYIEKAKPSLSKILRENRNKFEHDFESNFIQGNSFRNIIAILWWVLGFVTIPLLENKWILYIVVSVVWIGIGIWYWKFSHEDTTNIANYFFKTHQYNKIIEEYVRRDEQYEIQKLIDEIFKKDELSFVELDNYKFKLEDIKSFYNECLDRLKHEDSIYK